MADWATILYTSGTTGQGKGVILTQESMSTRMDGAYQYFIEVGHPLTEEDPVLSFLPLSHIFERSCAQWPAIYLGASIAYADSPSTLMNDLQKYNPTWFSCVPRLYEKIYTQFQQQLDASPSKKRLFNWALGVGEKAFNYRVDNKGRIDMRPMDLPAHLPVGLRIQYKIADKLFAKIRALFGSRFRFSFSASAGIAPDLLRFFYIAGIPVIEGYGLTETTGSCTYNPMKGLKVGTIGPQANESLARIAEDGELEITGAGMFIGYLNKPEENEACFTPDGWFRTGDLAEMDEDGFIKIVDRKKAIICLAIGKNVAPLKLESLFTTNIAVEQIFIIGDEQNFITALIVPDFNYFVTQFDHAGIDYDEDKLVYSSIGGASLCVEVGKDFIAQPLLQKMVAEAVQSANQQLENFETIKHYEIIPRRFTEENGELTPTMKTKKQVILKHYHDVIEELYTRTK
ncbi:MAG: AMP-binding protein [Bacillota bacterium]|nr:AMP-binding protein [Bacillota bacterium]